LNVERSNVVLEWEAREEAKALRVDLLRVLRFRFGDPLAEEVTKTIQEQADLATLDAWFTRALVANSLDELRPVLGLGTGQ
jgi:hypothetical protein